MTETVIKTSQATGNLTVDLLGYTGASDFEYTALNEINGVNTSGPAQLSFKPATSGTTIYNFYFDQRSVSQTFQHTGPSERTGIKSTLQLSDPSRLETISVDLRSVLLVGGLIILVLAVGAAFGNAVSSVNIMHPFLVVIIAISGLTFIGMSKAEFP